MSQMKTIRGIAGVTGRTPIGAAISVSRRDRRNGPPAHKDGFWIMDTHEDNGMRNMHQQYSFFNNAAPNLRQTLQGYLIHHTEVECFEWHRQAMVLPGLSMHPRKRAHCKGDGVKALRWTGNVRVDDGVNDFAEIECLGDKCEFAQAPSPNKPPPCKPWMRFIFLLTWKEGTQYPPILAKFTSGSWNTLQNFVGFFADIKHASEALGVPNYSLIGYPLTLHHIFKTQPDRNRRFQVIEISPRMPALQFLGEQAQRIKAIKAEYGQLEAITDQTQLEPKTIYEDHKAISWPSERK